jgi:hypothetical protein
MRILPQLFRLLLILPNYLSGNPSAFTLLLTQGAITNIMRTRLHLAAVCFLIAAVAVAVAELRSPTAAEKAALDKYLAALNPVLDQFQGDDWDENVEYSLDDPQVNTNDPGVPLDINERTQRTYTVRNGSQRFNEKIAPSMQQLMSSSDMNAKVKIGQQVQSLMRVQVQVHFNRANLGFEPAPANNHDLHIPGAAFAYKIDDSAFGHGTAYILAFGNWNNSKWDAEHGWYHFHFAHPQNTPYIENIEVRIYGADDRIQQLLHSIDWNALNNGLTR